ncbi:MAG: protein kinase [Polyangiaceae bacterium]|nr:protein kinase [Polyangiaceae bacterium]
MIEHLAGSGGMSEVYRAEDRSTGRPVAVKVFTGREGERAARFAREARVLARLSGHPGIVEYIASGAYEGIDYLAMEWLQGEDLAQTIARATLSVDDTLRLASRIASALGYAHARGVVHRDVKPANIFLRSGDVTDAIVVDFGISRDHDGGQITRFGEALGTPAYMAPEQAKGLQAIDPRADVFALGCVLYECLAGQPPFWADHPLAVMAKILLDEPRKLGSVRPEVPPAFAALVDRMLLKDPAARPQDGAAVARELAPFSHHAAREPEASDTGFEDTPSITSAELQLLSLLFVGGGGSDASASRAPREEGEPSELDEVYREVLEHGGWAERLVDGSIVVTLPGRGPVLDQAAKGARCALAIRRVAPNRPVVLATGRAVVSEGFPVGEVIERGVALLARVPPGHRDGRGVWIDDVTAGLLDHGFRIESEADALVLMGEREADPSGMLLGKPRPFVGRERDLRFVQARFDEVATENAAAYFLVVAPPGGGKSRLAVEVSRTLENRVPRPVVIGGAGHAANRSTPLATLAGAMRRLFGLRMNEPHDVATHRVRARVGRNIARAERDRVAAFLGELVGVSAPAQDAPAALSSAKSDPVKMGDLLRGAWEGFLRAELAVGPVVVVVDDLDEADAASLQVLGRALDTFADQPLLVVGFARGMVKLPRSGGATEPAATLTLSPLSTEASSALVLDALDDVTTETARAIAEQANGNPLHLEELIRSAAAGRRAGSPESALAMVQERLDGLNAEARRVLRACSILGEAFTVGAVAALLAGASFEDLGTRLGELSGAELLVPTGAERSAAEAEYAFRSTLVRDAAYATLTDADRTLGHRLAAEWLEQSGASYDATRVAEHYERAGEERRATVAHARAAELAMLGGDFVTAVAHAERGVEAGAEGALLGRLRLLEGEAHRHLGENTQMLERSNAAMQCIDMGSRGWWTAGANAALAAIRLGNQGRLDDLCGTFDAVSHSDLPAGATRAAHYLQFAGRESTADLLLSAAMQSIGAYGDDPSKWGWGYRAYATKALLLGDIGRYAEQLELAVAAFDEAGDIREVASERSNLGFAFAELGLYEQARACLVAARASAIGLGLKHVVAASEQNLGAVEGRLGAYEQAHTHLEKSASDFRAQGNKRMEGNTRIYRARVLARERRLEEALAEADRACELLATIPTMLPSALASRARALLGLARAADALEPSARAIEMVRERGRIDEGEALIRLVYAEVLAANHDARARDALEDARERLLERAGRIRNVAWRAAFLDVEENRRTLDLAALMDSGADPTLHPRS